MNEDGTFDWQRPLSPNYLFNAEEREIIVKCINILTNDYHFDRNEFISLTGTDNKDRFAETVRKLKDNQDLDGDDEYVMTQAVLHVVAFPMAHRDEVVSQFDVKMFQLRWFAASIRSAFETSLESASEN